MSEHSEDPSLYVVYLGGDPPAGRLGEDHQVVLVVGSEIGQVRAAARAKWGGETKAHVDAVLKVGVVDGYRIHLEPTDGGGPLTSAEIDNTYEAADS